MGCRELAEASGLLGKHHDFLRGDIRDISRVPDCCFMMLFAKIVASPTAAF